jgi:hypothetical protein
MSKVVKVDTHESPSIWKEVTGLPVNNVRATITTDDGQEYSSKGYSKEDAIDNANQVRRLNE